MNSILKNALWFFTVGAAMMLGMRTVELLWLSPPKKVMVLVCTVDEGFKMEACKLLKTIEEGGSK